MDVDVDVVGVVVDLGRREGVDLCDDDDEDGEDCDDGNVFRKICQRMLFERCHNRRGL